MIFELINFVGQFSDTKYTQGDRLKELHRFLKKVPTNDRKNLQKIIDAAFGASRKSLCDQFIFLREGAIGQIHSQRSYKQLVTDVADYLVIDWKTLLKKTSKKWQELESSEIEDAIVIKVFSEVFHKLPEDKQRELLTQVNGIVQEKDFTGELITASSLTLAKLSGFQVYLLATTTLGAMTGMLGITLPFVVYTTLTSTIAIALSPVGWLALGAWTILRLDEPDWSRLTAGIIYVSYLRRKLEYDSSNS
jgi:uncharacterized protein YaaW (UPF0174 family)